MHTTVTQDMFIDSFLHMQPQYKLGGYRGKRWDRLTLRALFNYLEETEEACDIKLELDRVKINDDYNPWYSVEDFLDEYSDHYKSELKEYKDEGKEIKTTYQLREFLENKGDFGDANDFIEVEGSDAFITTWRINRWISNQKTTKS